MEKLIEFKNFTVKLSGRVLYDDINLTITEGDRFIFIGPNGAGKSLLLELIANGNSNELADRYKGLSVSGCVLNRDGLDLLDPKTENRRISYIPQSEEFYNNSTLLEEVESSCHGARLELDENKLMSTLERFGIRKKLKTKIKNNFSNGEEKIISIISRLMIFPETDLYLMDEPLNHLSFQNSKVFNDIVLEFVKENPKLAIIMVSHCRAASFAKKAIEYTSDNKLKIVSFSPYDCFTR